MQHVADNPERTASVGEAPLDRYFDSLYRRLPDYDKAEFEIMLQCDRFGHNHNPNLVLAPEEILDLQDARERARQAKEAMLRRVYK